MTNAIEGRLGNLLALTDVSLTRLDVDDFLAQVLERLCTILRADTAAVLLRQPNSEVLVARAAFGLEEEVRQGVRVPIGVGFAGRIAADRKPVVLDRVDETTVANPLLWRKGIGRMLGVPLLIENELLGVVHVGRLSEQSFDAQDIEMLERAAERIAAAVKIRDGAIDIAAGALLERGLLPAQLPALANLRFASRYAPAEDRSVGGDWYDAFVLPSGYLWLVIGDVAGHGLNSAVVVSRVKSALRSYALIEPDVAQVVRLTNEKLLHFEVDTIVTLLCAVAAPPFDHFRVVSAGHLSPLLVSNADASAPDERAHFATLPTGPPLGAVATTYSATDVELGSGTAMLMYTDGLIERRDESITKGMERLRASARTTTPEILCQDVMMSMVGDLPTRDDVALLAVQYLPTIEAPAARNGVRPDSSALRTARPRGADPEFFAEISLPPEQMSVRHARAFVTETMQLARERYRMSLSSTAEGTLKLLVSELATNSVIHARSDFSIQFTHSGGMLRIECADSSDGLPAVQTATTSHDHGRGMSFVSQFSDTWGVERRLPGPGKKVWFCMAFETSEARGEDTGDGTHA